MYNCSGFPNVNDASPYRNGWKLWDSNRRLRYTEYRFNNETQLGEHYLAGNATKDLLVEPEELLVNFNKEGQPHLSLTKVFGVIRHTGATYVLVEGARGSFCVEQKFPLGKGFLYSVFLFVPK
jgi:hypothetical protein